MKFVSITYLLVSLTTMVPLSAANGGVRGRVSKDNQRALQDQGAATAPCFGVSRTVQCPDFEVTLTSDCSEQDFVVVFPVSENPEITGIQGNSFTATANGNTYVIPGGGNTARLEFAEEGGLVGTTRGSILYQPPTPLSSVPDGVPKSPLLFHRGIMEIDFAAGVILSAVGSTIDVCAELAR